MERSLEEQARLAELVDGLSPLRMMQVMNDTVGIKRGAELVGWAVLWGLKGEPSGRELRLRLEEKGMTEASAYRALADYRRLGDAILKLDGYDGEGILSSLRRLAACLA